MASSARIDELLKKFEENPRRYFAPLANEYRKAGDVQRAIALCREHLPQQPGHMSGHIVYGQALFEAREFDEARQVFEEALRLDPENLIALRHLGDIARDHGDVASARDWYQRVLDADPRNEEIAAQIAGLASMPATAEAGQGADAHAVAPALDSDLIADIAAGVAEPPAPATSAASGASAPVSSPASTESATPEHDLLDDSLLGASFPSGGAAEESGRAAPEAPSDYAGTIDLPGVEASSGAETPGSDDALDFDAMEGIGAAPAAGTAGTAGTSHDADRERARADAPVSEVPTEELSITELSVVSTRDDDASFGDIDLSADSASRAGGATLDLDDSGMAPTPAAGVEAAPTGGADFSDFALADSPVEGSAELPGADEGAAALPESAAVEPATLDYLAHEGESAPAAEAPAADASEGYSLGRLSGLESMEFVPPEPAAPTEGAFDPTYGRTLREDAEPSAATPAAFVTETMAELYLQQGFRDEALGVYRQLLEQNPNDANLRDRVAQLERGSVSTVSAAAVSDSVIEAAQQRGAAPAGGGERTVRAFFASLAARRAPASRASADRADADAGGPAAEARAADAYVEATGEGYDEATASDVGNRGAAPRYDDFGFPTVESSPESSRGAGGAAAAEELPESAAIEPATLDYLAHEGAADTAAPQNGGTAEPAGPVDTLFDGAAVSTNDEAAAATLADAFGAPATSPRAATGGAQRVATPGRGAVPARDARTPATRPAARELSLDDVFRETPRRSGSVRREGAPSFSFDQFFAEGSASSGKAAGSRGEGTSSGSNATPASDVDAQRGDEDGTSADIEQFNAWLEGLKKK